MHALQDLGEALVALDPGAARHAPGCPSAWSTPSPEARRTRSHEGVAGSSVRGQAHARHRARAHSRRARPLRGGPALRSRGVRRRRALARRAHGRRRRSTVSRSRIQTRIAARSRSWCATRGWSRDAAIRRIVIGAVRRSGRTSASRLSVGLVSISEPRVGRRVRGRDCRPPANGTMAAQGRHSASRSSSSRTSRPSSSAPSSTWSTCRSCHLVLTTGGTGPRRADMRRAALVSRRKVLPELSRCAQ